jgi:hypothetical protein
MFCFKNPTHVVLNYKDQQVYNIKHLAIYSYTFLAFKFYQSNKFVTSTFTKIQCMKYCLLLASLCISLITFSQKKKLYGIVKDSATKEIIEYASITNVSTNKTTVSNTKGRFSIEVSNEQILSIASINHYFDTLQLNEKILQQDTLIIYLKAITQNLKEVTVTAILNRYQNDSTQRRKRFLEDVGSTLIPTVSTANSGAGMGINLDRFSRKEKNKRKAFELFEKMEKEQYINYRFSPQFVIRYTTLRNDSLFDFMQQHRPTYKWLRKHVTEEDLKYYINDKLKIYFKRKENE